jgi:hypothetical protein
VGRSRERTTSYLKDKCRLGNDVLKKIFIFTLLLHRRVAEDQFFSDLMATPWYQETIDLYFNGEYEHKYREVMEELIERRLIIRRDGFLVAGVKP